PDLAAEAWVDETLADMNLAQQAAQLVFARLQAVPGVSEHDAASLAPLVEELGLGGVVLFRSPRDSVPGALDRLQEAAPLPLLVAADLERGLAFRIPQGTTSLPYAMAIGASGSTEGAHFAGTVTAR